MIISFPSRNKRKKKRERETAALNNHTIKTIKLDFEVCLASKSQQYICWRNGVLDSADRRRWTAVSALDFIPLWRGCYWAAEDTACEFPPTELGRRPPESTALSRPSKTCPAIPPRRQNQPSVSSMWRALVLAHNL